MEVNGGGAARVAINRRQRRAAPDLTRVPHYTGSIDARVPAENIVLSHFMPEIGKWVAASHASDDCVFLGHADTEPLARRAAGLKTLDHLQQRAEGHFSERSVADVEAARIELVRELEVLTYAVTTHNGVFPATYGREVVLVELKAARELLLANADRGVLVRWIAPPILFLSGAFAQGIVGAYAEKVLDALSKLLAN